uniref:BZIP domain-containing protein n=1 Tax=Biomphalaria glabrata TaxID=6526 RepID=A0A2C9LYU8_BIOGL
MVRVVSQNFSPPRSRHSSGDTDRDLAERTNLALSSLGRKKCDLPEYESSSDSFWDSELDGEHYDTVVSESGENSQDINGNAKSDVQSKRRERRRERNKLSAQAYRMRRRTQNVKEQQELMHLEAENKRLHKLVEALEKKKEDARQRLRGCSVAEPLGAVGGMLPPQPSTHKEIAHTGINTNNGPSFNARHDYTTYHPPLNPHPALTPSLPHPNQVPFKVPENAEPVLVNSNSPDRKIFCPSNQNSPSSARIFFNSNDFKGTLILPECAKQIPAVCFPAVIAVPLEIEENTLNLNLNCKPVKVSFPKSNPTEPPCPMSDDLCSGTLKNEASNATWWRANGNPQYGSQGESIPEAVFSGKMEMCNANMNNSNFRSIANDPNGNCDKNLHMQQFGAKSPQSFNMNHIIEETEQTQVPMAQLKARHPKKQYYDQHMPVSVQ